MDFHRHKTQDIRPKTNLTLKFGCGDLDEFRVYFDFKFQYPAGIALFNLEGKSKWRTFKYFNTEFVKSQMYFKIFGFDFEIWVLMILSCIGATMQRKTERKTERKCIYRKIVA